MRDRIRNHPSDFNYQHIRTRTNLAKHIWKLKEEGHEYSVQFTRLKRAPSYMGGYV